MNLSEDESAVKIAVRECPLREIFKNNGVQSEINYHSSNSNILIVDGRPFAFDHVLLPSVSQEELYNSLIKPLVDKVFKGFHCTALAYGQTGTGKSFTMGLNPESSEGDHVGMIPRCVQAVLNTIAEGDNKLKVWASFIEIYSEKAYDLLSENPSEPIIARGYKFTGGTKKAIETIQDGYTLLNQGTKNRHVRPTKMNPQSSRSHAIFTLYVKNEINNQIIQSCLNLVDLAGSEGVRRTGHQGVALSEGVHINQGLLSIGKVLQAITHGYKVIPYRDSVLSSVLQESLNPNSYLTLLACISPHREDMSETLSTLRFAQNAKNLKHNPQINSKLMEIKKAKTPYKSKPLKPKNSFTSPTPLKRPFSLANIKTDCAKNNPKYHGNTFCTPNKKRKTEIPNLNHTNIGLTPKEKQKIGSVKMPISKVVPFSYEPSVRESLNTDPFNDIDLDCRASLLSLNISSSTTIDAQPVEIPNTYSPIVRKCMDKVENTIKSSMSRFLESLKDSQNLQKPIQLDPPSPTVINEQKIRTIIRQELLSLATEKQSQAIQIDNGVNRELFGSESSPVFKVPEIPSIPNSTQKESFLCKGEIVLSAARPFRRSQRISVSTNDDSVFLPRRRSSRLSSMKSLNDEQIHDDSVYRPRRRSARISSIKTLNDSRRRSIHLASHKEEPVEEDGDKNPEKPSTSKTVRKRKKDTGVSSVISNPTIAGYFENGKANKPTDLQKNLAKHQKAILEMLNTASMKELQYLPQVGLKTAFQIVTQRTLHGKFKNFTQVSKLPIWRGSAWERFKEANSIS